MKNKRDSLIPRVIFLFAAILLASCPVFSDDAYNPIPFVGDDEPIDMSDCLWTEGRYVPQAVQTDFSTYLSLLINDLYYRFSGRGISLALAAQQFQAAMTDGLRTTVCADENRRFRDYLVHP